MHNKASLPLLLPQCDFLGQPSVVVSSSHFLGARFSNYVDIAPLLCTAVSYVSRVCVSCV